MVSPEDQRRFRPPGKTTSDFQKSSSPGMKNIPLSTSGKSLI
jgi:hypothetical protein